MSCWTEIEKQAYTFSGEPMSKALFKIIAWEWANEARTVYRRGRIRRPDFGAAWPSCWRLWGRDDLRGRCQQRPEPSWKPSWSKTKLGSWLKAWTTNERKLRKGKLKKNNQPGSYLTQCQAFSKTWSCQMLFTKSDSLYLNNYKLLWLMLSLTS